VLEFITEKKVLYSDIMKKIDFFAGIFWDCPEENPLHY
jgi:hypothetical protein